MSNIIITADLYDHIMNTTVEVPATEDFPAMHTQFSALSLDLKRKQFTNWPKNRPTDSSSIPDHNLQMDCTSADGATHQEAGEFVTVKSTRKRSNSGNSDSSTPPLNKITKSAAQQHLKTQNRFNPLTTELLNDKSLPGPSKLTNNSKRILPPKNVRPISIQNGPHLKPMLQALKAMENCSFTASPAGEFTRIYPDSPENYKRIVAHLDHRSIPHYLIPEKSQAPLKVVIRGLPIDTEPEEIEEELKNLNFAPLKINQLTKFSTQKKMPLFQIHLPNTNDSKKIFDLKTLSYYIIKVENYNRPSRTMQCFKCQYFHHSSVNCKLSPRCVKCAGEHETRECTQGQGKIEKISCCNCGATDHPASYRGCPKFPENIRKAFVAKKATEQTSYASALRPKPVALQHTPTPPSTIPNSSAGGLNSLNDILNAIAQELEMDSFADLISKFTNVLNKMRNTPDKATKLSVLMEALSLQPSLAP